MFRLNRQSCLVFNRSNIVIDIEEVDRGEDEVDDQVGTSRLVVHYY